MSIRNIIDDLNREIEQEKKLYRLIENRRKELAAGSLEVSKKKYEKYYIQRVRISGTTKNISLDPSNDMHRSVIMELMEKKTVVHGAPILRKNIEAMEKCVAVLSPYHPTSFQYGELLGEQYYLDDDVCIKEWEKKLDNQNSAYLEYKIFDTKKGDYVRSKSEAIIADTLFDYGIKYKYEPRIIVDGKVRYPDFEVLHPVTYELNWWEHLGRLDDPVYVWNNLEKITTVYGRNGIVLGKNLILTYETSDKPLTRSAVIERLKNQGLIQAGN